MKCEVAAEMSTRTQTVLRPESSGRYKGLSQATKTYGRVVLIAVSLSQQRLLTRVNLFIDRAGVTHRENGTNGAHLCVDFLAI